MLHTGARLFEGPSRIGAECLLRHFAPLLGEDLQP